ncbi:MAG TPA: hypothetical protein VF746_16300 [Longimicrobium sp.]|jgi:hypothetical protein
MIPLLLWSIRWRFLALAAFCLFFYLMEPGFHFHGVPGPETPPELVEPSGLSFSLANLAGLSVLVLLWGFVATDRRRGYYRIYFSHPTRPLTYYGVRWLLGYGGALATAALFLVLGQLAAWGEIRTGARTLEQAALMALVYGGITAFFSVLLRFGDSLLALGVFAVTETWQGAISVFAEIGTTPLPPTLSQVIAFILPPHATITSTYQAWEAGVWAWGSIAYVAGYGIFWLVAAGLLLHLREWP